MLLITLSLRLIGDRDYIEPLLLPFRALPFVMEPDEAGGVVVRLPLMQAQLDSSEPGREKKWRHDLADTARVLVQLQSVFQVLDRHHCNALMSVAMIRDTPQNVSFTVPPEVVAATGAANLALSVSWYLYDPSVPIEKYG